MPLWRSCNRVKPNAPNFINGPDFQVGCERFSLFIGGEFYFGFPVFGGSGLGLVLLIVLVIYFAGGFRGLKSW